MLRSRFRAALALAAVTFGSSYACYVTGPHRRAWLPFVSELDFYGLSRLPFTVGLVVLAVTVGLVGLGVAHERSAKATSAARRAFHGLLAAPLLVAGVGLAIVALVNVPRNALWHGRGALLGFTGMIAWGAGQIFAGWADAESRRTARGTLIARTLLVAVAALAFLLTLAWFGRGLAEIHADADLMAFYRLEPRPPIFLRAAAAEWTLVLAGLGTLATVTRELEARP
ncbi:MAG: hypothetical protein IPK07_10270 [Deltaproteobacteria bacterium]|nr:hypothetical protein [Deltaproteobacteria bacterium]